MFPGCPLSSSNQTRHAFLEVKWFSTLGGARNVESTQSRFGCNRSEFCESREQGSWSREVGRLKRLLVDPEDDEGGSMRAHQYMRIEGQTSSNANASSSLDATQTRASRDDNQGDVDVIVAVATAASGVQRVAQSKGTEVRRTQVANWMTQSLEIAGSRTSGSGWSGQRPRRNRST